MSIRPAIIIGLGGTGAYIAKQLKKRLREVFSHPAFDQFMCLDIDTDRTETPVNEAQMHEKAAGVGSLRRLGLHLRKLHSQDRQTDGIRIYDLSRKTMETIMNEAWLGAICLIKSQQDSKELRFQNMSVVVVSSLAGGTGSGLFLDIAHMIRQVRMRNINSIDTAGGYQVPKKMPWLTYPSLWQRPTLATSDLTTLAATLFVTKWVGLSNIDDVCLVWHTTQTTSGDRADMNRTAKRIKRKGIPLGWFNQVQKRRRLIEQLRKFGFKSLANNQQCLTIRFASSVITLTPPGTKKDSTPGYSKENKLLNHNADEAKSTLKTIDLLRHCAHIADARLKTKQNLPEETIIALQTLGDEIRKLRASLGVNRAAFSKRVGIDLFELTAVENSALLGSDLCSLVEKIDQSEQTNLLEQFPFLTQAMSS